MIDANVFGKMNYKNKILIILKTKDSIANSLVACTVTSTEISGWIWIPAVVRDGALLIWSRTGIGTHIGAVTFVSTGQCFLYFTSRSFGDTHKSVFVFIFTITVWKIKKDHYQKSVFNFGIICSSKQNQIKVEF